MHLHANGCGSFRLQQFPAQHAPKFSHELNHPRRNFTSRSENPKTKPEQHTQQQQREKETETRGFLSNACVQSFVRERGSSTAEQSTYHAKCVILEARLRCCCCCFCCCLEVSMGLSYSSALSRSLSLSLSTPSLKLSKRLSVKCVLCVSCALCCVSAYHSCCLAYCYSLTHTYCVCVKLVLIPTLIADFQPLNARRQLQSYILAVNLSCGECFLNSLWFLCSFLSAFENILNVYWPCLCYLCGRTKKL